MACARRSIRRRNMEDDLILAKWANIAITHHDTRSISIGKNRALGHPVLCIPTLAHRDRSCTRSPGVGRAPLRDCSGYRLLGFDFLFSPLSVNASQASFPIQVARALTVLSLPRVPAFECTFHRTAMVTAID